MLAIRDLISPLVIKNKDVFIYDRVKMKSMNKV
jgi:hypothetical protein